MLEIAKGVMLSPATRVGVIVTVIGIVGSKLGTGLGVEVGLLVTAEGVDSAKTASPLFAIEKFLV